MVDCFNLALRSQQPKYKSIQIKNQSSKLSILIYKTVIKLTLFMSFLRKQSFTKIKNELTNSFKLQPRGSSAIQQLEIKFTPQNKQAETNQIRQILSKYLAYPSSQIALVHMNANRLGCLDLEDKEFEGQIVGQKLNNQALICPCCGFIEQKEPLSLKDSLAKVNHIGISTYLYFLTIKNLSILLFTMLLVYSTYSIITNKMASDIYSNKIGNSTLAESLLSTAGNLYYSSGSKQLNNSDLFSQTTFSIQCWLGVAMVALWAIIFAFIKYWERKTQYKVDYDGQTAADYTLLFENLPKQMTKQQLQIQLEQYRTSLYQRSLQYSKDVPIKIAKINRAKPFYLQQKHFDDEDLKEMKKKYEESRKQLVKLIKQRQQSDHFAESPEERNRLYEEFTKNKNQKQQKIKELVQNITKQKIAQSQSNTHTQPAFVTFSCIYNKEFIQRSNDPSKFYIYGQFCPKGTDFDYLDQSGNRIRALIEPAPQPENILWTNLGQGKCQTYRRKLLTFAVTAVILCISFAISCGFSYMQLELSKKNLHVQTKTSLNSVLSLLMSLSISIINMIINKFIYDLTQFERNSTYIRQQTSVGVKAVIATLFNSILNPILVNHFFKSNLYGTNGLAQDVFTIALTSSMLSPVYKILDFNYVKSRLWKIYDNRPHRKLKYNQKQLNKKFQLQQFSIGYQYIHIVNLFIFTCFFVSLQPAIVIFALFGFFLMYWAQKYSLFNRCKRPTPGSNAVNTAMYQLIYCGPLMYSLGSFCWSNILNQTKSGTVPNIVAIIISGIILLIPYKVILKNIVQQKREQNLIFEENRLFLPSQYDRLNPLTSQQGIRDYLQYISEQKKSLQNQSVEQVQKIFKKFQRQNGASYRGTRNLIPGFIGFQDNLTEQIASNVGWLSQNSINPLLIGQFLLPDDKQDNRRSNRRSSRNEKKFNIIVQNWLTSEEQQNNYQNPDPLKFIIDKQEENRYPIRQNQSPEDQLNDGDIKVSYNNAIKNNRSSLRASDNQNIIPMNLPTNLFGRMLSPLQNADSNGNTY